METKFQTSFIPKKPIIQQETTHVAHSSTSIVMVIGVICLLASLAAAAFTFVAKGYLTKTQDQYKIDLTKNEERLNDPLIEDLRRANAKIDLAKQLIKNHAAVSKTLDIIAALTAERVYFTSFDLLAPEPGRGDDSYRIAMKGIADSFNSIAFQSDVFGRSTKFGTNKTLKNPILSDLTTDNNGDVNFNFTAQIPSTEISYEKILLEELRAEGSLPQSN